LIIVETFLLELRNPVVFDFSTFRVDDLWSHQYEHKCNTEAHQEKSDKNDPNFVRQEICREETRPHQVQSQNDENSANQLHEFDWDFAAKPPRDWRSDSLRPTKDSKSETSIVFLHSHFDEADAQHGVSDQAARHRKHANEHGT